MGSFLSYLFSCVSNISKHRPGCCNMKKLPTGARGTQFAAYSSSHIDHDFYFQCCKSNIEKRHSSLPTSSQAPVLLVVKPSSSLLQGRLHTGIVIWFMQIYGIWAQTTCLCWYYSVVLQSKLFMTVGKSKLYSGQLCIYTALQTFCHTNCQRTIISVLVIFELMFQEEKMFSELKHLVCCLSKYSDCVILPATA